MKAVIFIHVLYLILIKAFMVKGVSKCESKVELRAVLISCPTKDTGCEDDDLLSQAIKSEESQILQADLKNFDSLKEEKEKGFSNAVKDCKRKLVITLKIKNIGRIPCDDEYIIVDHVFDPVTGGRGRLLSPVVLKLRQEQMTHLYGLQFQRVVNSDPFEEQKTCGQTCSVSPENPTCGIAMYDGKPIPFSEGFCCSCNPHVNAKRQLASTNRKDSLLDRDYNMIYQGNPHFVREGKAPIVDPSLIKLRSDQTSEGKKDECGGFGDPLSWDKIPNYLLEHDRKVVCDRGDFMNELCKLQEDKYYAESSSGRKAQSKGGGAGKDKKNVEINKRDVKVEEADLKKQDLTTVAVDVDASKENLLKDAQGHNVILLKSLMKTLNVDQSSGAGSLSDNYNAVKGSRGKRENRNENKKLTLEEKLERFVNSKSHLTNPRKRLLELSHKRRRKVEDRCVEGQQCRMPLCVQKTYEKCSPPKYFFCHDKFIIDPLESAKLSSNSSCKKSNLMQYEEAKDKTFELQGSNVAKHEGKVMRQDFYEGQPKNRDGKEKIILEGVKSKKSRRAHNEGGKTEKTIDREEVKTDKFEESLKSPNSARGSQKGGLVKAAEENKEKGEKEQTACQEEKKIEVTCEEEQPKEQKASRLSCKCFKNLFRKSEPREKCTRPQKIRNFFMARNRDRQKFRPEIARSHKKAEDNRKISDFFKCKNTKEEKACAEALEARKHKEEKACAEAQEARKHKEEEKEEKISIVEQQEEQKAFKTSEEPEQKYENCQPQRPLNRDMDAMKKKTMESEKVKSIKMEKQKEEENEEKAGEKLKDSSQYKLPKEMMSDTDFSFEIIRHQFPQYMQPKYHRHYQKPIANTRISVIPSGYDTEFPDSMKKYNYLNNKQKMYYKNHFPQKYYILENDVSPSYYYSAQKDKKPFREIKTQRYFKKQEHESEPLESEPEFEFYENGKLDRKPEPENKNYLQKRPLLRRRFHKPVYNKYDGELARYGPTFQANHDNKLGGAQRRGEHYPESLRGLENEYLRVSYGAEKLEGDPRPRLEKVRNKRSFSYSFQPAKGFFRSEIDSRSPEGRAVDELETCLPGQSEKARRSDRVTTTSRVNKQTNRQSASASAPARSKRENVTSVADEIPNSQRLPNDISCPVITLKQKTVKSAFDKQRLIQSYLNAPDYVLEEVEAALKEKRQTTYANKPNGSRESEDELANEQEFQETAHCMRFGDMWYSLYSIKKPMVAQTVGIQLFDKHLLWDGTSQWRDLTKGKMIRVGTFLPKAEDELPSISVNFVGGNTEKCTSAIDPDNYYLLIPSHVSNPSKMNFYPQFDGGPAEYLLVHSKDVSAGGECNMVGTSFEAFARQPDRCNQPKGSCLKRQPVDLWREDMEARIRGKRGKYFVENFGTVPNSSIKTYTNLSGEFLALEYYGEYTSTIEIEVKADSNAVVRKGSNAQIPLVYVDSTYPKKTRIILSVLNIGLTSSYFRPRLGDCPPDLDPAWCPLEGPLVTIPPQQRHDFKLDLSGVLPSRQIRVSVEVLNQVNKKIASRKINIKKGERCVCAFHCKCNCIGNAGDDKSCRRLSLKDYRRAGYIGSFPFRGGTAASAPENILKNIHIVFLTAIYVLLLLGVVKGILGIFIRRIGIAGVKIITGPRELCRYYESELQSCSVLFDEYGFPVHPTTCQPVQIVPLWLETIMNIFFFFLYPLRGLWFLILSLPCCKAICCECENCSRSYEGESDRKCSRPLLSKGLSPTCVHYNLTTINSKKSKQDEYLPYPAYKGDDDPLEEDDTEFVLQEMKRYRKE